MNKRFYCILFGHNDYSILMTDEEVSREFQGYRCERCGRCIM